MKKFAFILVFIVGAFAKMFSNELLQKAEKAYDGKNYSEAIKAYDQLIKDGFKSYELYYNLGNSYYRHQELGKAIYYYELARKLNPNDKDVQVNLGIASSKTIDKIDAKENFFINAVKSNVVNSLTTNTWALLSIVIAFAGCLFFFLFINSQSPWIKRVTFGLSVVVFFALIIVYVFGNSALNAKKENKFAIILNKEVHVNNEPNQSAVSKFSLHEGTKVRVIEANSDWVMIKLDNGNEGWVKQSEVGII